MAQSIFLFAKHCCLALMAAAMIVACRTPTKNNQSSADQSLEITEEDQIQQTKTADSETDDVGDSTVRVKFRTPKSAKVTIAHPKKADAWTTRRVLMISPQPAPAQITQCSDQVDALARRAINLRDMDLAATTLEESARQSLTTYHWCFYQLMGDLDIKLERDQGPTIADKADLFLVRMKTLWVLGRTLDSLSSPKKQIYSTYLRARYVEISQSYFGRAVEVIDPHLLLVTGGKSGKPAKAYQDP